MEQNFPNRSNVFCVFRQMCNFIASNKCETKTKVKHPKHLKHQKHQKHQEHQMHQAKASEMPNHAKHHASERVPQEQTSAAW